MLPFRGPGSGRLGLLAALLAAVLAPLLLGAGPGHSGCGSAGSVPTSGIALPEGELECAADVDCAAGCADVRCVAGECVEVAPMVDADGDGEAPLPCGGDCDDSRAQVAPGLREVCDGLDNDCNGLIDDRAPVTSPSYSFNFGDPTSIVLPIGDGFLMTSTTRGAIFGIPVTLGGETSTPIELLRLVSGAAFTRVAGARADDGRVLLVAQADDRALRYIVLAPSGDDLEVVLGPEPLPHDLGGVGALDVIAFDGAWAVGIAGLGEVDGDDQRLVWTSVAEPPVARIASFAVRPSPVPSFALATDGVHLVVSDAGDGVHFIRSDGMETMALTIPGLSEARHPLASSDGAVVAVFQELIGDFPQFAYIDAMTGLGEAFPFFDDRDGALAIYATPSDLFMVRFSVMTVVTPMLWDLSGPSDSPWALTDASSVRAEGVSFAEGDRAIAVGGGTGVGTSVMQLLRACAAR